MKPGYNFLAAAIVTCAAISVPAVSAAAEAADVMQELVNVKASQKFDRVLWLRGSKHYSLQFVPLRSSDTYPPVSATNAVSSQGAQGAVDRGNYFIGNTIANLRGLDPEFDPPRVLTMVDGWRPGTGRAKPAPAPSIQVWLLRADGTQIIPTWNATYKLYSVTAAEGVQVAAAAIQIDDEYYIEKLRSLESTRAVQ